eukprot:COSAG01_NODE_24_length_37608_cov_19.303154_21_plen_113_part_00
MKEHKETVNSLVVRGNDLECVSACNDGSCIIWDLQRFVRRGNLLANTFFKCVRIHLNRVPGGTRGGGGGGGGVSWRGVSRRGLFPASSSRAARINSWRGGCVHCRRPGTDCH